MPVRKLKKEKKPGGFSSTSQKGNILHGKLKSQKELKSITGSEEYKKSDYEGKTKMLNVATANKGGVTKYSRGSQGAINPGEKHEERTRTFLKKRQKKAAKIEMVSKLAKRQKQGKYGKSPDGRSKATDTEAALTTFDVQKIMDKRKFPRRDYDGISDRSLPSKEGSMRTGGQAKIAAKAPPRNKIDAKDFAVLRAEKAKGRGMGLQDEKVKPGKVMNARVGKSIKKDPTKTVNPFEKKSSKFMERRKALGTLKSSLKVLGKAGKAGAIIGAIGAAGAGAAKLGQTLGRKMSGKKNKDGTPKKKMGGGMMQKPMGYKSGKSIKVKCKLGRNKPTKMY